MKNAEIYIVTHPQFLLKNVGRPSGRQLTVLAIDGLKAAPHRIAETDQIKYSLVLFPLL